MHRNLRFNTIVAQAYLEFFLKYFWVELCERTTPYALEWYINPAYADLKYSVVLEKQVDLYKHISKICSVCLLPYDKDLWTFSFIFPRSYKVLDNCRNSRIDLWENTPEEDVVCLCTRKEILLRGIRHSRLWGDILFPTVDPTKYNRNDNFPNSPYPSVYCTKRRLNCTPTYGYQSTTVGFIGFFFLKKHCCTRIRSISKSLISPTFLLENT